MKNIYNTQKTFSLQIWHEENEDENYIYNWKGNTKYIIKKDQTGIFNWIGDELTVFLILFIVFFPKKEEQSHP